MEREVKEVKMVLIRMEKRERFACDSLFYINLPYLFVSDISHSPISSLCTKRGIVDISALEMT